MSLAIAFRPSSFGDRGHRVASRIDCDATDADVWRAIREANIAEHAARVAREEPKCESFKQLTKPVKCWICGKKFDAKIISGRCLARTCGKRCKYALARRVMAERRNAV